MGSLQSTCCGPAPRCASVPPHTTSCLPPGTPCLLSLDCSTPQSELTLRCLLERGPQQGLSKHLPWARCGSVNAEARQCQRGPWSPQPSACPLPPPGSPPSPAAPPAHLPTSQQAGPPGVAFTPRGADLAQYHMVTEECKLYSPQESSRHLFSVSQPCAKLSSPPGPHPPLLVSLDVSGSNSPPLLQLKPRSTPSGLFFLHPTHQQTLGAPP